MIKITNKILFPKDTDTILMDVVPKHEFNIYMGPSIKNLQELADALEIMDEDIFEHHVTKDRNDFSNWVNNIICDTELSKELLNAKTKEKTFEAVSQRVKQLKKLKINNLIKENLPPFNNEFLIGLVLGLVLGFLISAIINRLI